jgi:large subunit ribosomal protein L9
VTRLLLRADVDGLGRRGDIVQVSDGYARNYLVPKGHAVAAGTGIERQAEVMRQVRDQREARDREAAEAIARQLVPAVVRIPARAGSGGRLFGSVTAADVVEAVNAQTGIDLDRRRLVGFEAIRALGVHEIPVKLHADVEFRVTVEVTSAS